MKRVKYIVNALSLVLVTLAGYSQDPSFSQFFSSPLNINPALTANINADWRLISNFRHQWTGPASPYTSGSVSYDRKMSQKKYAGMDEEDDVFGLGAMLMYDRAMSGIVNSSYASLNISYDKKLIDGRTKHRIGIGFGSTYGNRRVDFSRLDFQEQFTGHGFNTNLPTGEVALSNMKPYLSAATGLTYTIASDRFNMDLGAALFHLNRPKQTFLEDEHQYLATRKVFHVNAEAYLNDRLLLNTNAIYQYQLEANYVSVGGAIGYLADENTVVNFGVWYWSKNAIIPYFGLRYQKFQFGASYDITTSKLNEASRKPSTWELSLILRGETKPTGVIHCPWK